MTLNRRRNRIAALALCLLALASCSRQDGYSHFREASGDGSRYDFDLQFAEPDAEYDTFIAFNMASSRNGADSIPARIAIVSPSGQMAIETVAFPLHGVHFSGNAVEYHYRSGIKVAQDTGLWHLSITLQDPGQYSFILGAGFRCEQTGSKN